MARGRRMLTVALVVVASVAVVDMSPAAAHSCAVPVTVVQGEDTQVQVGVTVGDEAAEAVTFQFADSFELTKDVLRPGWTVEQVGTEIQFSGGHLEPGTCVLFDVSIRAREAGTFRVRAFQLLGDGQVVEHPPDGDVFMNADGSSTLVNHEGPANQLFEQVIEVTPHDAAAASSARAPLLALTAAAALAALVVFFRRRR